MFMKQFSDIAKGYAMKGCKSCFSRGCTGSERISVNLKRSGLRDQTRSGVGRGSCCSCEQVKHQETSLRKMNINETSENSPADSRPPQAGTTSAGECACTALVAGNDSACVTNSLKQVAPGESLLVPLAMWPPSKLYFVSLQGMFCFSNSPPPFKTASCSVSDQ